MSEHPKNYLALHYRSKRRALNLAFAFRGRSTGWGDGKPRRWFVGHHKGWAYHRGVELMWRHGGTAPGMLDERVLFAHEWGASPEPAA